MEQFEKDPEKEFLEMLAAEYRALSFFEKIMYHVQDYIGPTLFITFFVGLAFGYCFNEFGW